MSGTTFSRLLFGELDRIEEAEVTRTYSGLEDEAPAFSPRKGFARTTSRSRAP